MAYQQILVETQGPIGTLTLNRPTTRNAMTAEMGEEIAGAVQELNARPELRVVLVRGAGPAFCAGGDLEYLQRRMADTPEGNRSAMKRFYLSFLAVADLRVPSIAVIHGPAIGAGLCLAMACDLRLAASATRLAVNFVRLGLHPGMGATYFLPRLVGMARASELLLTGGEIDGERAAAIGLVNAAHPPGELEAAALALAERVASAGPLAVEKAKTSLAGSLRRSLDECLDAEAAAQAIDYASADLAEGVAAARERRPPRFAGR